MEDSQGYINVFDLIKCLDERFDQEILASRELNPQGIQYFEEVIVPAAKECLSGDFVQVYYDVQDLTSPDFGQLTIKAREFEVINPQKFAWLIRKCNGDVQFIPSFEDGYIDCTVYYEDCSRKRRDGTYE